MLEIFKRNIIKLLKHSDYRPLKLSQLAKALGVSSEDYSQFKEAFEELRRSGQLVLGNKNLISLLPLADQKV